MCSEEALVPLSGNQPMIIRVRLPNDPEGEKESALLTRPKTRG